MQTERASIFIDGGNLYHNLKGYKIRISFEEIIKRLETKREVTDVYFYTAELDETFNPEKYKKHHEFLEKLREIPKFHVVLCNLKKTVLKDGSINYDIKGDDVHLASDLIKGSYEDLYDVAIVVSGDEDFVPAIKIVRANKKKVINAFFPKSSAYLLKNCCDGSINLKKALSKNPRTIKSSPNTAKP